MLAARSWRWLRVRIVGLASKPGTRFWMALNDD